MNEIEQYCGFSKMYLHYFHPMCWCWILACKWVLASQVSAVEVCLVLIPHVIQYHFLNEVILILKIELTGNFFVLDPIDILTEIMGP